VLLLLLLLLLLLCQSCWLGSRAVSQLPAVTPPVQRAKAGAQLLLLTEG
jgi:hypothetical protein